MESPTTQLKKFTNLYQLSKTLRFELKLVGKTKDHIETKGILKKDEERAESYKEMKKTIDGFHKHFIEMAMRQVCLTELKEFNELYYASAERKKEDSYKKELERVQTALRKEIVKGFDTGDAKEIFSKIDKKELITKLLEEWIKTQQDEDIYFDEKFKTFTTYFTGFHENRKNMYTDKEQSTAIAYRLVNENLPKFLDNIKIFEQITEKFESEKIKEIETNLESVIQGIPLYEIFRLDYYNQVLTQNGIDFINNIIGGYTEDEGKKKIQGLNEHINLYNQKQEKKNRIPKLKILYKQILSDRDSISWLPEAFEDDKDKTASQKVLEAINLYFRDNLLCFQPKDKKDTENILEETKKLLAELSANDLSKVYIRNDRAITDISQALFKDFSVVKEALKFNFTETLAVGKNGLAKKQEDATEKYLKQAYFSILEIENALFAYKNETDALKELKENTHPLADYFTQHFKAKKKEETDKDFDLIYNIEAKYSCIKGLLNGGYPKDKKLNQDKKTIGDIKAFLDALMELLHFVKPLALPNDSTLEKDQNFYSHFEPYFEQLELLISLYNKVRNYAAKKPYSTEKFKLNFENPEFLGGWPRDREIATSSVIFKDKKNFYLGVLDKDSKKYFKNFPKPENEQDVFYKMVYLQAADPSKDVQNLMVIDRKTVKKNGRKEKSGEFMGQNLILEELKNTHLPENINEIRKNRTYSKQSDNFSKNDLVAFIDYYKQRTIEYFDSYKFKFKKSDEYKDFGEFTTHVNGQAYQINFIEISHKFIDEWVNTGKLYLFQIYNKDFSPYSKGKSNMHTLYWKALFEPENLKDVVYKLNGQAEVFYRKKSIEEKNTVMHKANEPIDNKNPKAKKKQSTFEYDLVKDKRYTVDKFQFHVPITLNFKATGNDYINQDVLTYLKNNPEVNIIGLDRGERHLIYLTLINQKGEILLQESLNTIVNKKYDIETPYHTLLQNKEDERAKARENWGVIENIKELKEGYISQVVHKIAKLMVEHNAIVVMEDLNTGFKRGRFKVEKQVYQKLEKMLIDKLNYLVFKDKKPNEVGGLYHALQLTNKFESFSKIGKQSGFLFYVPAWNTSKIDPTTGFVNLFYTKYESVPKAQAFFENFKSIRYNSNKKYFEFDFDYNDFTTRAEGTKTEWTVCSYGDRIKTFRNPEKNNQWDNQEVNLTEQFEVFFGKKNITYGNGNCIKNQLIEQDKKEFFEELFHLFKLTLQMRNSITNSEIDYLISPVKNSKGEFYDSRKADSTLPKDADANGAYHIAKKGLQWVEQIQKFDIRDKEDSKKYDWKKLDLNKTNKGWLQYVQPKN
ncbi:MAG: type V CRISPR-associated protein Cas12a/Cpf1 [Flavobacteriaceae bacterium]|nr:type V CRISPR-associated protein Cas12a/Cpf1 [Flavobacteriaceae bacterium]MDZ4148154.1 type V CRISPR-associated protein Cas12a/Cpf1 [Flavobacteriaceae bacterium]